MKLIRVDFNRVTEDGLVRSFTDRANTHLFMYDMVLAHDGTSSVMAQVVEINGNFVKVALDPAARSITNPKACALLGLVPA